MLDAVDPVPDDLVERVRFALALDEVYDEVARMSRVPTTPSPCAPSSPTPPAPRRSPSPRSG